MAKEKFIVTSDCRFGGKVVAKGTIVEFDPLDREEGTTIALLNRSGRIGQATPENIRAIQGETKAAGHVAK